MHSRSLHWTSLLLIIVLIIHGTHYARSEQVVSEINFDLELKTLSQEEVKALMPVRAGDLYANENLEEIKKNIEQTELFENVEVKPIIQGKNVTLTIQLVEARLIRRVNVSGNYPYPSKKILRLSSLQPGEMYHAGKIAESEQRIKDFLSAEGFFDAEVKIITQLAEKHHAANIKIKIKKNNRRRLGTITVNGNENMNRDYIANKVRGVDFYKPKKIKKRLQKIQVKYIKKGFVRARIKMDEIDLNPRTNQIDLTVQINERQNLKLQFVGNLHFKDYTLKQYVSFYQERGYDSFALTRSIENLTNFYHANGFLKASVDGSIDKQEEAIQITFLIDEGRETRLKKIIFEGNKSFGAKELKKIMNLQEYSITKRGLMREDYIKDDLERISKFYQSQGFFDMQILGYQTTLNQYEDRALLTIQISEGSPYKIDKIKFTGNRLFDTSELYKKSSMKVDKKYSLSKDNKTIKRLKELYQAKGYAYMDIVPSKTLNPEENTLDLEYTINEYYPVKIGRIVVTGKYLTHEKVIRDALKVVEGDLYIYDKILDSQLTLKRIGIFDFVSIEAIGIDKKRVEVDLHVRVQERKTLTLDIEAGFDSDKLVSGEMVFTKRNLFGMGKHLQLRGIGGFELNRGEVTFFSPRIFGAAWNLVNQYFAEYEDDENFNATSFGGFIGATKNYGPYWTLTFKTQINKFDIFENESNQEALEENLFDSTFSEVSIALYLDTRNNYADPSGGIYAMVSTEFDTDLANPENNFNISQVNLSHFMGLNRFTLVNVLRAAKISLINAGARIPATKLFFMGGNDTIRGFDEDAIREEGGTVSLIYNAELQFRIISSIKLAGFFDIGSLTSSVSEISADTFRESAGVGLRYMTPVGPIRLDYGFVLDKRDDEDGQRFHFSFGYFF